MGVVFRVNPPSAMPGRARSLLSLLVLALAMAATCGFATAAPAPPLIDFDHPGFWPVGPPVATAGPEVVCEIAVSLDQPTTVGGFRARVLLRSEPGWPSPDPVRIAPFCRAAPGVELQVAATRRFEEPGLTAAGVAGGAGFAGPGLLFSCSLDLGAVVLVPTTADFETLVVEAYDPHSAPIEPLPSISITDIECQVIGTTTLKLGSTTTTFPELTTTTLAREQEETCFVTFGLGASRPLGGIEFGVDYASAEGQFAGAGFGEDVQCADGVDADSFAAADDEEGRVLGLAISRSVAFGGPAELVVCSFQPAFAVLPMPADFMVLGVSAVDDLGAPVEPAPQVTVSALICPTPASSSTSTSTSSSLGLSSASSSSSSSTTFPPPSTTVSTLPAAAACADPAGDGVSATDALVVLQAGIAARACRLCICDADGNGQIAATDALIALQMSVGTPATLACPTCGG